MTQYAEAKEYFTYLAKVENIQQAKETMRIYKKIKKRRGEFLAARFILEVYQGFNKDIKAQLEIK